MAKILAIGEALFDYIDQEKVLGGAPLNFAIHCVQLGAEVSLLTRVGQDDLGAEIIDTLATRGVDIQYVQSGQHKATGKVVITTEDGEPDYEILTDMAWDYIEYPEFLENFDCIYFGTLAQRNQQSRETIIKIIQNFQGIKCLDLNLRRPIVSAEIIEQSIRYADILKLNLDEAEYLQKKLNFSPDIMSWLTEYNLQVIVLTQGEFGTKWLDPQQEISLEPVKAFTQPNADTVGAGDGVCATIVTGYLDNLPASAIVNKANNIGAYIASCQGATPTLPLNLLI